MDILQHQYQELITLTLKHLKQEFSSNERMSVGQTDYKYFYDYAVKNRKKQHSPPSPPPASARPALTPTPGTHITKQPTPAPMIPLSPQKEIKAVPPSPITPQRPPLPFATKTDAIDTRKSISDEPKNHFFVPASPLSISEINHSETLKSITTALPHLSLTSSPPSDAQAHAIANAWKQELQCAQVVMLIFDAIPSHIEFLENVAKAIRGRGYSVELLKAEKINYETNWKEFTSKKPRLIIANDSGIQNSPFLSERYRELTKNSSHSLGDIPLLLLTDLSFYLKEPSLKLSLWNAIKERLPLDLFRN